MKYSPAKCSAILGDDQLHYEENLTAERPTFVTHLECAYTGERHAADAVHNLSRAGKPLLVHYDLAGVAKALSKEALAQRAPDLWRYRELLPVCRGSPRGLAPPSSWSRTKDGYRPARSRPAAS